MEKIVPKREYSRLNGVLLSSLYLAPVEYYAVLFHADKALIEIHDHYQKQSFRNRCIIAGANGSMTLSIPVEKPKSGVASTKDVRISDHGNWRHLHWNAIRSAYSSTPFFQYYEDDFKPFYEEKHLFLYDFNEQVRRLVCRLIGIETPISYTSRYIVHSAEEIRSGVGMADLREVIHPKRPILFKTPPYYQVFSDKLGFLPNLSILDLLFNLGSESRIYLGRCGLTLQHYMKGS